jgi:hypothetical protein
LGNYESGRLKNKAFSKPDKKRPKTSDVKTKQSRWLERKNGVQANPDTGVSREFLGAMKRHQCKTQELQKPPAKNRRFFYNLKRSQVIATASSGLEGLIFQNLAKRKA